MPANESPDQLKIVVDLLSQLQGVNSQTIPVLRTFILSMDELKKVLQNTNELSNRISNNLNATAANVKKNIALFDSIYNILPKMTQEIKNIQQMLQQGLPVNKLGDQLTNFNVHALSADETLQQLNKNFNTIHIELEHMLKNQKIYAQLLGETKTTEHIQALQEIEKYYSELLKSATTIKELEKSGSHSEIVLQLAEASEIHKKMVDSAVKYRVVTETFSKSSEQLSKKLATLGDTITEAASGEEISTAATAIENIRKRIALLPPGFNTLSNSFVSNMEMVTKLTTGFMHLSTKLKLIFDSLNQFSKFTPGVGVAIILMEIGKLFLRGLNIMSSYSKALGESIFTVNNLSNATINLSNNAFKSALSLKTMDEMMNLIGMTVRNELFPPTFFLKNTLENYAGSVAEFAEHIDTTAQGIGLTGDKLMSNLLSTASIFNVNISNLTKETAQKLTNTWASASKLALQTTGLTFQSLIDMSRSTFESISFLGRVESERAVYGIMGLLQTVGTMVREQNKNISFTMQQMRTMYTSLMQGIEQSSWEMYYGILAMSGKLSGNLNKDLEKVFMTSPVERFVEQLKFFREIGQDVGVGTVFTAFTNMIGKIPDQFVVPLSKALQKIDMKTLDKLLQSPNMFFEELLKDSGLSPDEIATLQRTTKALEDPLKTMVTFLQKIYDIVAGLSTFITRNLIFNRKP